MDKIKISTLLGDILLSCHEIRQLNITEPEIDKECADIEKTIRSIEKEIWEDTKDVEKI